MTTTQNISDNSLQQTNSGEKHKIRCKKQWTKPQLIDLTGDSHNIDGKAFNFPSEQPPAFDAGPS